MLGDGNGWVHCSCGRTHWGRHGAAGLLVTATTDDGPVVLLQMRAAWTHDGGTWALPGGARDSHERPIEAALREAGEETSLDLDALTVYDELVDDHGPWSYTTLLAHREDAAPVRSANAESDEMRWLPLGEVDRLPLHRGFAATWPVLRERVTDRRDVG
ncbi:NUDIX hydrolase [Jatrophihabitans fulvus]